MHDFDPIDIAWGQFVQRYDIFRVMVFDLQQVGNLPVGFLRQIAAYLHIDPLVPSHSHEAEAIRNSKPRSR